MAKRRKNKIHTAGYFIKRLKDSGYVVLRIFEKFSFSDPRRWTIIVDPGNASIFITCYENKDFRGEIMFEINDGGRRFPKNYSIKTDSIEIIVSALVEKEVPQNDATNSFFKPSDNVRQTKTQTEESTQGAV